MFKANILGSSGSNAGKVSMNSDEVGRYVSRMENALNSPHQKKMKGLSFARLYFDSRDYASAKKYLNEYLGVCDRDYRAHNLMGRLHEATCDFLDAISAYKRSLELCSSQKDIILKVIELCCKAPIDPLRAKVWADRGSRMLPGHPSVFQLKWHLMNLEDPKNYQDLENLLADELSRHPREPHLHVKLLLMYMEMELFQRAFAHGATVEGTRAFDDSVDWLTCAANMFDSHRRKKEFIDDRKKACIHLAVALCKLLKLHLRSSSLKQCAEVLQRFDETVRSFQYADSEGQLLSGFAADWKDFLLEMKGHLYLFCAIYILKMAKEFVLPWRKACLLACAALMTCLQVDVPTLALKLNARKSPMKKQNSLAYTCSVLACCRLSQAGHIMLAMEEEFGENWVRTCVADFCGKQGQDILIDTVYGGRTNVGQSLLVDDDFFTQVEMKIPSPEDLIQFDEVTIAENAEDLQLIIWLGLHWNRINEHVKPGVGVLVGRLFNGIPLDVKNISNCNSSTMCLRDVDTFIYAVVRSAKSLHLDTRTGDSELKLLPPAICDDLVTPDQLEWWQAAYGLYTGKVGTKSAAKLKAILQKGLETIRLIGNHGIDPRILHYVGMAFWEKALTIHAAKMETCDYQDHWESLERRGTLYLKEALRILEIFLRDKTVPTPEMPLIPPLLTALLAGEASQLRTRLRMHLGDAALKAGDLHLALSYFEELKTMQAFYNQAQIYLALAEQCNLLTAEGEKSNFQYLYKARERLHVCINNSDDSPEYKQSLIDELAQVNEIISRGGRHLKSDIARKSLTFGDEAVVVNDAATFTDTDADVTQQLAVENSILQEQLDEKELEVQNLNETIAMMKAQMLALQGQAGPSAQRSQRDLSQAQLSSQLSQEQLYALQILEHDQRAMQGIQDALQGQIGSGQDYRSDAASRLLEVPGSASNTPNDLWWDTFSPAPSFERGYFAGLVEHVELTREAAGEKEAPTMMSLTGTSKVAPVEGRPTLEDVQKCATPATVSSPREEVTPKSPGAEDSIHFEPIVKLSSVSDIGTGEEDEEVKFSNRGKLFRYDQEAKQWKERGLGTIKILFNAGSNKARILMRREQVLRICCNHYITEDMKLEAKSNAHAAWSWVTGADFSEGSRRCEKFTIKFKTADVADQFQQAFLECQQLSKEPGKVASPGGDRAIVKPLRNLAKKAEGSWSCGTCLVFNPPDRLSCLACEAPNPGSRTGANQDVAPKTFGIFKFGVPSVTSSADGGDTKQSGDFSFETQRQPTSVRESTPTGFVFGTPASSAGTSSALPSTTVKFGVKAQDAHKATASSLETLNAPVQTAFGAKKSEPAPLFRFGNRSELIAESNDGKPVFSFATNQQHQQGAVSSSGSSVFSGFSFSKPGASEGQPRSSSVAAPAVDLFSFARPVGSVVPFPKSDSHVDASIAVSGASTLISKDAPLAPVDGSASKQSPFAGFSFRTPDAVSSTVSGGASAVQPALPGLVDSTENVVSSSTAKAALSPASSQAAPSNPFSGFSFSNKLHTPIKGEGISFGVQQAPSSVSKQTAPGAASVSSSNAISGIAKLPVFAKGPGYSIDPTSFWSTSPQKTFFTGDQTALASIAHQEQPREVPEEEFFGEDWMEDGGDDEDNDYGYYDGENYEDEEYGDENANYNEYYGRDVNDAEEDSDDGQVNDDEDEDEDDDDDENGVGYQPSQASSGRRNSNEEPDSLLTDEVAKVEDRFNIPRRKPSPTEYASESGEGDIFISFERKPNFAQKIKAARLGLPPTFYFYDVHPPCPGCRGCDDDLVEVDVAPLCLVEKTRNASLLRQATLTSDASVEGTVSSGTVSFSSLAASMAQKGSGFDDATGFRSNAANPFTGVGARLFASGDAPGEEHDIYVAPIAAVTLLDDVKTGEEDDVVLFKERGKLYVFLDKQWKERGVGEIKISENAVTGYCRVIMRRDVVRKLCANHPIMPEMLLKPMTNSDRAWIWGTSSDYSDGAAAEPRQFCIKFRNQAIADEFRKAFEVCQDKMKVKLAKERNKPLEVSATENVVLSGDESGTKEHPAVIQSPDVRVSEPATRTLRIPTSQIIAKPVAASLSPESPSKYPDEEVDIHVEPIAEVTRKIIPTGEENENVLFSGRAKLYRFEKKSKDWKERGVGDIKVLQNSSTLSCRVVMRRDQVHKICANHAIVAGMRLVPFKNTDNSLTWITQADLGEDGEPTSEQFCVRFKTADLATAFRVQFEKAVEAGGARGERVSGENAKSGDTVLSFKERLAPRPGSWECATCLVRNDEGRPSCAACQSPNPGVVPSEASVGSATSFAFDLSSPSPAPSFSFGVPTSGGFAGASPFSFSFGKMSHSVEQFKARPPTGGAQSFSFGDGKDGGLSPSVVAPGQGMFGSAATGKANVFNSPATYNQANRSAGQSVSSNAALAGFAETPSLGRSTYDKFAADPNTWECPSCMAKNNGDRTNCRSCDAPRQRTPVVKLDPHKFSAPIVFNEKSDADKPAADRPALGLRERLAPKPGSWVCSSCSVSNGADFESCPCCAAARVSGPVANNKASALATGTGPNQIDSVTTQLVLNAGPSRGGSSSLASKFAAKPGEWNCHLCLVKNSPEARVCPCCGAPKPGVGNEPSVDAGHVAPVSVESSGFTFGQKSEGSFSGFSFGTKAPSLASGFSFGAPKGLTQSSGFSFGASNVPPAPVPFGASMNPLGTGAVSTSSAPSPVWGNAYVAGQKKDSASLNKQASASDSSLFSSGEKASTLALPKPFAGGGFQLEHASSRSLSDAELMPPPNFLPARFSKTSPKHESKTTSAPAKDSIFSWLPKGLTTDSLFSFGRTPSPAPSAASSVDDLTTTGLTRKPESAFGSAQFSFNFEPAAAVGSKPKSKFSVQSPVKSPANVKSPGDEDVNEEDVEQSFEFTPLISLNPVKASTGEEAEKEVFAEKAKLFKFDVESKQWKERGVGVLKVLESAETSQRRIVMRRDHVHKVCANHVLMEGMTIKPMSGSKKAHTWMAHGDIADGEPYEGMFAARFKDIEVADRFADVFNRSCSVGREVPPTATADEKASLTDIAAGSPDNEKSYKEPFSADQGADSDDISVAYVGEVNAELKDKARRYLLPASFYHVPSVELGAAEQTYDEKPASATVVSDLVLTYEKSPAHSDVNKAQTMLLPRAFYTFENDAALSERMVDIVDCTPSEESELHRMQEMEEALAWVAGNRPGIATVFSGQAKLFLESPVTARFEVRGKGTLSILQDSLAKVSRVVMQQDGEGALCANHVIDPNTRLSIKDDSRATWEWVSYRDLTDGPLQKHFAAKFDGMEVAERFKAAFDRCRTGGGSARGLPTETASPTSTASLMSASVAGRSLPTFSTRATSGVSFANFKSDTASGFENSSGKLFEGAGARLFASVTSPSKDDADGDGAKEGYEPDIHVEPIAAVTAVDVSSGEENENVVFKQRTKLYKFDAGQRKWKECGVGDLKLLQHKTTSKARLVMRREQVGKLCANHYLHLAMKLEPFPSSDLAVSWHAAMDVSRDVPEDAIFAARFKNQALLGEFKNTFSSLCRGEVFGSASEGSDATRSCAADGPRVFGACDPALVRTLK